MKKKAFSYLRVSGKGQINGDGFPRQAETIARYAKANRIEIVQEFRDKGVSGAAAMEDALDRPGLTDLFVALKANDHCGSAALVAAASTQEHPTGH